MTTFKNCIKPDVCITITAKCQCSDINKQVPPRSNAINFHTSKKENHTTVPFLIKKLQLQKKTIYILNISIYNILATLLLPQLIIEYSSKIILKFP